MPFETFPPPYPPVDADLVERIVSKLKSQGIFDQFRKDCLADVDTKPAYQNLQQRVNGTVATFLATQTWQQDLNKTQLRESLRRHVQQGFLEVGVDRIVDQVVNPKIIPVFMPKVEDVVCDILGVEKPSSQLPAPISGPFLGTAAKASPPPVKRSVIDLLPKDLEPVSPESESLTDGTPTKDERNNNGGSPKYEQGDSQLSGISELSSHVGDSFRENPADSNTVKSVSSPRGPQTDLQFDNFTNLSEKIRQAEMSHGQVTDPNFDTKKEDTIPDALPQENDTSLPKDLKEENNSLINNDVKLECMSNNSLSTFEDSKNFVTNKFLREETFTSLSEDSITSSGFTSKPVSNNISKPFLNSENSNNSQNKISISDRDEKPSITKEQIIEKESNDSQTISEISTKVDLKCSEENKESKKGEEKEKKDRDSSASSKMSRSSDKHRNSESKHRSGHEKRDEKEKKDESKASRDKGSQKEEKERSSREDKDRSRHKDDKYSSKDKYREKDKSKDTESSSRKSSKTESKDNADKDKKTDKDSEREKSSKDKHEKDKSSRSKHDRDKDRHEKEKRERDRSEREKDKKEERKEKDKADKDKHEKDKTKLEKERDGQNKDREKDKDKSRNDKDKYEKTKHDKDAKHEKEKSRASDDKKDDRRKDSKKYEKSTHSSSKGEERDKKSKSSDSSRHKQNGEKSKGEEERRERKRKGERCNDEVKSKEARRSSDRDSSGGKGGGGSHKAASSDSRVASSRDSSHSEKKSKSSNAEETTDSQEPYDQPSDEIDGPSEVEKIITQLNSSIEQCQNADCERELISDDTPVKKPKIAKNIFEIRKIMQARKNIDRKFKHELKNRKEGSEVSVNTLEAEVPPSQPNADDNIPEENKENIKAHGIERKRAPKPSKFIGFQQSEIDKSYSSFLRYHKKLNQIINSNERMDEQKSGSVETSSSTMEVCRNSDNEELLDNNLNNLRPKLKSLERSGTIHSAEEDSKAAVDNLVNGKRDGIMVVSLEDCSNTANATANNRIGEKNEDEDRLGVAEGRKPSQTQPEPDKLTSPPSPIKQPIDSPTKKACISILNENNVLLPIEGIDAQSLFDKIMEESLLNTKEYGSSDESDYEIVQVDSGMKDVAAPKAAESVENNLVEDVKSEPQSVVDIQTNSSPLKGTVDSSASDKTAQLSYSNSPKKKSQGTQKEGSEEKMARRNQRLSRSSQRYESTDLYKPRPVLPQNSKRIRTSRSVLSEESQQMKRDRSDSHGKRRGR